MSNEDSILEKIKNHEERISKLEGFSNSNTFPRGAPSVKEFLLEKCPANKHQRIACLAFFRERYQDVSFFTGEEIINLNDDARQEKILPGDIINAEHQYGFIGRHSVEGKRQLLARGEKVVDALPDQKAVKDVLLKFSFKRKKVKKESGNV